MDDKIPYVVYEASQAKHERTVKRLIMALMLSIILLFACNAAWLYAWMQYDYSGEETHTEAVTVDGKDGIANYIGNTGDIINGSDSGD